MSTSHPKAPQSAQWGAFYEVAHALLTLDALAHIGDHGVAFVMRVSFEQCKANVLAVEIWNNDLLTMLHLRSPRSLAATRTLCIDAGWIAYENRGNRKAGVYRAKIPGAVSKNEILK